MMIGQLITLGNKLIDSEQKKWQNAFAISVKKKQPM